MPTGKEKEEGGGMLKEEEEDVKGRGGLLLEDEDENVDSINGDTTELVEEKGAATAKGEGSRTKGSEGPTGAARAK